MSDYKNPDTYASAMRLAEEDEKRQAAIEEGARLDVWAVVFGNYEPAEVAGLFDTEAEAEAEADRRNEQDDSDMWRVLCWPVYRYQVI